MLLELIDAGEDEPQEPTNLLEIVQGTPEVGYEPIGFAPNPEAGSPYPMVILEISPREYDLIRNGQVMIGEECWRIVGELAAVSQVA